MAGPFFSMRLVKTFVHLLKAFLHPFPLRLQFFFHADGGWRPRKSKS